MVSLNKPFKCADATSPHICRWQGTGTAPGLELAHKSTEQASTKLAPFQVVYGRHMPVPMCLAMLPSMLPLPGRAPQGWADSGSLPSLTMQQKQSRPVVVLQQDDHCGSLLLSQPLRLKRKEELVSNGRRWCVPACCMRSPIMLVTYPHTTSMHCAHCHPCQQLLLPAQGCLLYSPAWVTGTWCGIVHHGLHSPVVG